jgi:hypothetical protein
MTEKIIDIQAEVAQRQARASEGLTTGKYTLTYLGQPDEGVYAWEVGNAQRAYQVDYQETTRSWTCDCPDFEQHGAALGTCKHCEMVKLARQRARGARTAPAGVAGGNGQAGPHGAARRSTAAPPPSPARPASAQAAGPAALPASPPADQVPPGVANLTVPWGKYRGIRLGDLVQTEEGAGYLMWVMRKMEAKSEGDTALKAAAQTVVEARVKAEAAAVLAGQCPMSEVPFGEDKGKPLDKAHPKWTAILAKKSLLEAFTLKDAITYEVARHLKASQDERRGPGGWGRGGGLDPQVAEKLAAAIEHLAVAIEKVADSHGPQHAPRDRMLAAQPDGQ